MSQKRLDKIIYNYISYDLDFKNLIKLHLLEKVFHFVRPSGEVKLIFNLSINPDEVDKDRGVFVLIFDTRMDNFFSTISPKIIEKSVRKCLRNNLNIYHFKTLDIMERKFHFKYSFRKKRMQAC